MKKTIIISACLLLSAVAVPGNAKPVPSGKEIIKKMYAKYSESWYTYLTFKQNTINYKDGKVSHSQTWYEALSLPGKLVIKFDSIGSGSGIIFRQDSQYVFKDNKLLRRIPRVHDLLVLGFDVYGQQPEATISKLEAQGFDMSKTYETEWNGRPVYVVGAAGESDSSPQFWIDKEHLYFVRLLRKNSKTGMVQETQFNKYERVGGGWVAAEVNFYNDNKLMVKEVYSNIKAPEHLEASIFDIQDFQSAAW